MPAVDNNKFPKLILQEIATDGSDLSNPAADHRALFLGEDGNLHLKDSAGAVSDVGGTGGGGDLTLIEEVVLGAAAGFIEIDAIPNTYRDLVAVFSGRTTDVGSGSGGAILRMGNGGAVDTGANYAHYITFNGWTGGTNTSNSTASPFCGIVANSGAGAAGSFGRAQFSIFGYADAAKWRHFLGQSVEYEPSGQLRCEVSGVWKNAAAAVDVVRVLANSGNWEIGSSLALYGRG